MIVHSMDELAVINEIAADYINIIRYSDFKNKSFSRAVLKSNKFPLLMDVEYMSPMKNKWIILYKAKSKSYVDKRPKIVTIVTYDTPHGKYAIMPTITTTHTAIYVFFTPHFFSRYGQRMHINKTGVDLIKHYFRQNHGYAFCKHPNGGISATAFEGMGLGIPTENGNFLLKTFISKDIFKGEQVEDYINWNIIREYMYEEVFNKL